MSLAELNERWRRIRAELKSLNESELGETAFRQREEALLDEQHDIEQAIADGDPQTYRECLDMAMGPLAVAERNGDAKLAQRLRQTIERGKAKRAARDRCG